MGAEGKTISTAESLKSVVLQERAFLCYYRDNAELKLCSLQTD